MPCEGPSPHEIESELGAEIDKLTRLLCFMCGEMAAMNKNHMLKLTRKYPGLGSWWIQHQTNDEKRVRYQMIREWKKSGTRTEKQVADKFIKAAEKVHPVSTWHKEWFLQMATETKETVKGFKAEQRRMQKLKRVALKKLTPEERKALRLE